MPLSFLNWITFLWLLTLAVISVRQIVKGSRSSVYWVLPVLFVFCGVPLLLDELMGRPAYELQVGLAMAAADEITSIVYCVYISMVPLLLLWIGRSVSRYGASADLGKIKASEGLRFWHRILLVSMLISPVFSVFLSADPGQYLVFSSTLRFSEFYRDTHSIISLACNFSILAGVFLLATCRPAIYGRWPNIKTMLAVTPWLLIAVWIHGKRNIVAMAGLLLILAFHYRGVLRGAKAYLWPGIVFAGVLGYSFFFQAHAGRVSTTWYENSRIDYGRDDKIKMTIYAELHPEAMRILEYRGQSLLFYLTAFIPREMWPDKPLPYAQYFTSAMLLAPPRLWGWGMTTSWLEEAIANFGWLGILMGPLLVGAICRIGDKSQNRLVRLLTPLIACLFLLVEAIAFAPLFLLWLVLVAREKMRSLWVLERV